MKKNDRKPGRRRAGTRILLLIISLITIVFIVSGIVSFLTFNYSQGRVISKSKDKLVEYMGTLMCSTNRYVTNIQNQVVFLSVPGSSPQSLMNDIVTGCNQEVTTPVQQSINGMLAELVEEGLFNAGLALYVLPPGSGCGNKPLIVMSGDSGTIYKELPAELSALITMKESENEAGCMRVNAKNSYELFADGIPDLGLEGENMVSAYIYSPDQSGNDLWYFTFSSVHDQLAGIDSFYENERNNINTALILLIVGTTLLMLIITFLVLNFLIRRNITRPIDELESAAEKVMEGDFDVEVPVYEGEEFEGLKTAFNNMLASLRAVINMSTMGSGDTGPDSEKDGAVPGGGKAGIKGRRRGRSSILIQITILVIVILVISSGLALLLFWNSQARLAEESRQKIVRSMAEGVNSGHLYVSGLLQQYFTFRIPSLNNPSDAMSMFQSIYSKQSNQLIETLNDAMKEYPRQGFNGIDLVLEVMPPTPGITDKPMVVLSSEDEFVFKDLPEELIKLHAMSENDNSAYRERLNEDAAYMLAKDGLPYLGLSGEHLVIAYDHHIKLGPNSATLWFFNISPMGKQLGEVNSFYKTENRNTMILMSLLITIGVISIAIITFFGLGYLIRTRITRPVDELETVAAKVMEGDLDVEITISKGEEFERLKTAFNEMLKSLRDIIDRSAE